MTTAVGAALAGAPTGGPAPGRVSFHVDAWDPSYGTSVGIEDDLDDSSAQVNLDVERFTADWSPVAPDPSLQPPPAVLFVDGVRRIDARVWIEDPVAVTSASAGICASYAAGVICCCDGRAHLLSVQARHGLFTVAPHAVDIVTSAGRYDACHTTERPGSPLAAVLSAALQGRLGQVEVLTAAIARASLAEHAGALDADLLIVDGPLRGRQHLPRTIGLIKTHQRAYLPPGLHAMVGTLAAGQRTPVFLMGTTWDRHCWYLRLPSANEAPWAGVVRIECSADLPAATVVALADLSQAVLGRFASAEYKDARAPQNLYPIGGLERELRRRLGDPRVLYRALRQAAVRIALPGVS